MDDPLSALAAFDSCAISDALDRLKITPAVTGLRALTVARRISGRVRTVRLTAGTPPEGAPSRHLCTAAVDRANAGDVIVVEQSTGIDAAAWGGILSNAACRAKLSGVIIEGPARDIDEAAELGFPVFARSATARTARGRVYETETGGPVTIGETRVEEGDYVVADRSGCAFIPAAQIAAVIEAARGIAAREAAITAEVLSGTPISQAMGANYEHMLESK